MSRVHRLDAIRGLLALGVMAYHLGLAPLVFGTYGVYAFFTLSGFALEHVYGGRIDVRAFAIARVARLAPLWVPVVVVSAVLYGIHDPARIALNLSGAFGLVWPGATSIVTGGWSIGIEVGCYLLFPLLTRIRTSGLLVLTVALFAWRVAWMPPDPLGAGWVAYTQLPSFLCFFTLGMVMARFGDTSPWRRPQVATALGDMSYGVYLLHPLVIVGVGPLALVVTPILALCVHRWYEVPVGRVLRERLRDVHLLDVRVRGRRRGLDAVHDQHTAIG